VLPSQGYLSTKRSLTMDFRLRSRRAFACQSWPHTIV